MAPALISKVASGELSVRRALRAIDRTSSPRSIHAPKLADSWAEFSNRKAPLIDRCLRRIEQVIRTESEKWPAEQQAALLGDLQRDLLDRIHAFATGVQRRWETAVDANK